MNLALLLAAGDRSEAAPLVFDYVTDYDGAFLTDENGTLVQA